MIKKFFFLSKNWPSPPWYFSLCWALDENPPCLFVMSVAVAVITEFRDDPVTSVERKVGSRFLVLGLLVHVASLLSHKSHKSLQIGKDVVHFLVDWTFYFLCWKGKQIVYTVPNRIIIPGRERHVFPSLRVPAVGPSDHKKRWLPWQAWSLKTEHPPHCRSVGLSFR